MDNHAHFMIDCCGADISKIMKCINQSYTIYYNSKYKRHGHLFQDRFKSKALTEDKSILAVSSYIHNNSKDIPGYNKNFHKYPYSSLGIYLGIYKDSYSIVDCSFVMQFFNINRKTARLAYIKFLRIPLDEQTKLSVSLTSQKSEYRSERTIISRNISYTHIIELINNKFYKHLNLNIKYIHNNCDYKSFCVLILRSLCNLSCKEIGYILGNNTSANISKLYKKGYELLNENIIYYNIFNDLISSIT
jgi:hypothetical protein